jgi:hypothetical protein
MPHFLFGWRCPCAAHDPRVSVDPGQGSSQLTPQESLLLEDYKNAAQLTYHVDSLRDRLTAFFVAITGLTGAGLSIALKDDPAGPAVDIATALLLLLAVLGVVVTLIVARLRSVQIEHFRIISKIRQHFYQDDAAIWAAVELAPGRVPRPTHTSGSFMWFACIAIVACVAAGLGMYFVVHEATQAMRNSHALVAAAVTAAVWLTLLERLYMWRAQPPPPPPFKDQSSGKGSVVPAGEIGAQVSAAEKMNRTALVGVGVAGAISVGVADGRWGYLSIALGLTLLVVLWAFDDGNRAGLREHVAFSAVYALGVVITLSGITQPTGNGGAELLYWVGATALALLVSQRVARRRET